MKLDELRELLNSYSILNLAIRKVYEGDLSYWYITGRIVNIVSKGQRREVTRFDVATLLDL